MVDLVGAHWSISLIYFTFSVGFGACAFILVLDKTDALPLKPDLVLICLFIGNDLTECALRRIKPTFLESWFDRENLLLYLIPKRLIQIMEEQSKTGRKAGTIQDENVVTMDIVDSYEEAVDQFPWLLDPMKEEPTLSGCFTH
jgi:hypothetical protein